MPLPAYQNKSVVGIDGVNSSSILPITLGALRSAVSGPWPMRRDRGFVPPASIAMQALIADVLVLAAAGWAASLVTETAGPAESARHLAVSVAGIMLFVALGATIGMYAPSEVERRLVRSRAALLTWCAAALTTLAISAACSGQADGGPGWALLWLGGGATLLLLHRGLLARRVRAMADCGRFARRVAVVGATALGCELADVLTQPARTHAFIGLFGMPAEYEAGTTGRLAGTLDDLLASFPGAGAQLVLVDAAWPGLLAPAVEDRLRALPAEVCLRAR